MRWLAALVLLCASGVVAAQEFELRRHRNDCSLDPVELMFELSSAIETGDVNRLSALYDWNGMDDRAGRAVMDRLEAIAGRTLVDVVPVYPPDPLDAGLPPWDIPLFDRPPTGLRVEQVVPGSASAVSTTFSMHRRLGCWWVSL